MRVCHVCNQHPVDDGRVFHRACVGLAEAGYEVHLFGVGNGTQVYTERGVFVHPLPQNQSRLERFARCRRVAQMAADIKPDLFHVHEPELLGPMIARAGSRPVVYDVHESYLDILKERDWIPAWLRPFVRAVWDRWESRLVRRCAGVVVVTEQIAQRYYRLHDKVQVISNYPDLSAIENLPPVTRDGATCVFAGSITPDRGLPQVFRAFAILRERGVAVRLKLAGDVISQEYLRSLWCEADRLNIRDLIDYRGMLPRQEAIILQKEASIGLVPYLPVANSVAGMPNKLVECMAVGIPVVFSDFSNYRNIAGTSGAGIAVDPTRPGGIADAIEYLVHNPDIARQMGEAGKRAVYERFNWNLERIKLVKLYQKVLGG